MEVAAVHSHLHPDRQDKGKFNEQQNKVIPHKHASMAFLGHVPTITLNNNAFLWVYTTMHNFQEVQQ